jgi:tripartite-type tricarboxylate transporter receptor subunit TctC
MEQLTSIVRGLARGLSMAACAMALAGGAGADEFPTKPIRLVIPAPAGGATDVMARALQEPLGRLLGQPLVMDYRGGASGAIGATEVARAAPDGYTLLLGAIGVNVAVPLMQQTSYDAIHSFAPVSVVATMPVAIFVRAEVPAANTQEFIAYAKTKPQGINFATTGGFSLLYTELVKRAGNFNATEVNYAGGAPATTAMLSGLVDAWITTPSDLINNYIKSGQLRAIGVSTPQPSPLVPGAIPISHYLPDSDMEYWFGILAPAGTPPAVVGRINKALVEALKEPEVRRRFELAAYVPTSSSPQEMADRMARESERWGRLIREANIRVN